MSGPEVSGLAVTHPAAGSERYVGECRFLRAWPWLLVGTPLVIGWVGGPGPLALALVLGVIGATAGALLPWRFAVCDRGLALWFAFGRPRFLSKADVVVRVDHGGAVAFAPSRRLGYPLTDGLVERRRLLLRAVLLEHGFAVR